MEHGIILIIVFIVGLLIGAGIVYALSRGDPDEEPNIEIYGDLIVARSEADEDPILGLQDVDPQLIEKQAYVTFKVVAIDTSSHK